MNFFWVLVAAVEVAYCARINLVKRVVSLDNTCGGSRGFTCPSSLPYCSAAGWCGTTTDYGGDGCQSKFSFGGKCITFSPDNTCGPKNNYMCPIDLPYCSAAGWCGLTLDYGGKGCQKSFSFGKTCMDSLVAPFGSGSNLPVSTDFRCGSGFGTQCPSGECCSQAGW